jgi:hypothetical protein
MSCGGNKSRLETARKLAKAHFQVEPHLKFVFLLKPLDDQDPNEPIRLLEVVEGTIERGFEPIALAPRRQKLRELPLARLLLDRPR